MTDAVDDPVAKRIIIGQRRSTTFQVQQTNRALEKFTSLDLLDVTEDDYDDDESDGNFIIKNYFQVYVLCRNDNGRGKTCNKKTSRYS